jgi:antitoxin MazE
MYTQAPGVAMARLKITKWGNSLALRLPAAFAKQLDLRDGSSVETVIEGNVLLVTPGREEPRPLTGEELGKALRMLKARRARRRSGVEDFGPPVGQEVW